jgi:hypothetical protein
VIVGGRPQPYYRSPAHVGYYGRGGDDLDGLLVLDVAGLPLADLGLDLLEWWT